MDTDDLKKAKGYALRLFKLRPRSTGELTDKLRLKGFPDELIPAVISSCNAAGLLDDEAFARAWMESRLKKYGLRRVTRELTGKGIPKDMVQSAWEHAREDYDQESLVRQIAGRRMTLRDQKDVPPLKRKRRVMDYLARRGFDMDIISKVLRQL